MTTTLLLLIIACLAVMLISLSGVVFIWSYLRRLLENNLHYLVSFAAGVFLVVSMNLITTTLALAPSVFLGLCAVLLGFFAIHAINLVFPESHHHHEHERENCGQTHSRGEAYRILASDALHNIGDGLLLAPAFITNIWLGISATIGILIHEMVQEISEFFVLRESGYTTPQALLRNFLVSATILIGAGVGFFIASIEAFIGILLGIAAGGFLHVVVLDLIPRSVAKQHGDKRYLKFIGAALLGALIIIGINLTTNHSHGSEPHTDHSHTPKEHDHS